MMDPIECRSGRWPGTEAEKGDVVLTDDGSTWCDDHYPVTNLESNNDYVAT